MRNYFFALITFIVTGCSFKPPYERPPMPIPEHFKEVGTWVKIVRPPQIMQPNSWWNVYNDPILNDLETRLTLANQDLKVACSHYQEAIALAQVARSYFFPTLQALFNADRQKNSSTVANAPPTLYFNQILVGGFLTYELDAWQSVQNQFTASMQSAKASAAELAAVYLSLHAELANDYFALRAKDEQQRVLDRTVHAYKKALYLTQKRYQGGIAPISDLEQAETQLENAKTMVEETRLQRAQLEHAIAVLIGEIPSSFSLPSGRLPKTSLSLLPEIPSTLLLSRPDIVAAELRVQAANANIGVARAAFFPQFNLITTGGFQSKTFLNLLSKPSLFWSLGPLTLLTIIQPLAEVTIFDGGRLRGLLNRANAEYFATIAAYRKTVLSAFQDVEDSLAAARQLDKEVKTQDAAMTAAVKAWQQEIYRYKGGLVTFLQVVVVENIALQSQLASIQVHARRQIASVQLIKAIGGGWSARCKH